MPKPFRVAAIPYQPEFFDSFAAIEQKMTAIIVRLSKEGVRLAVFPEYTAMELAALEGIAAAGDLQRAIDAVGVHLPDYHAMLQRLAVAHEIAIVAGTAPVRMGDSARNVATIFAPSGLCGEQQKLIATRFERETWDVQSGSGLRIFDLGFVKLGINICYDVEFPLISRAMCASGAELIVCPSCTDTEAGYHRVRTGAQARALENQCCVLQSPLIGKVAWCPAIDVNYGAAGAFVPSDVGFPANGILAMGNVNEPIPVCCECDPEKIRHVRANGQVLNYLNWPEQPGAQDTIEVELVKL